ncbi:MAG TPA: phage terminase small subunit [Croceibacterium sp.]|nr:phage terminase small subunit [Croceibacterium sp.]
MTSLALRHRARMMARKNAESGARSIGHTTVRLGQVLAGSVDARAATEYELQRAALGEDLRALSEIQSIEKKIERKAVLLPKYDDWCAGVLGVAAAARAEGKRLETDDVLVQTMIWAIDCADAERAVPRAIAVIEHRMDLPARFDRTPGCLIAEEFAETAMQALRLDQPAEPHLQPLLAIEELTAEEDMPDQVRAKLQKALGLVLLRCMEARSDEEHAQGPAGGKAAILSAALDRFRRALQLDDKSGVKKIIEIRTRELDALRAAPAD